MISAELNAKINECLCREFQSLWLIDAKDYTMSVYASNEDASIPGAIGIVEEMNSYPIAKDWYIDNCIMEKDRERVRKMTQIEYLLPRISKDKSFFIEYSRASEGNINYNQLCFSNLSFGNASSISSAFIKKICLVYNPVKSSISERFLISISRNPSII